MGKRVAIKMAKMDWMFLFAMVVASSTGQTTIDLIIAVVWSYAQLARRVQLLEARGRYENNQTSHDDGVQKVQ